MATPESSAARAAASAQAVCELLRDAATSGYIGEDVSQLEHALQAAAAADRAGAPDSEVIAALLHDVGHLCAGPDAPDMEGLGVADHEGIGARWLADLGFDEDVTDLVDAHVQAKRYLVATRPDYAARLSEASAGTLRQQGGPMSAAEVAAFDASPRRDARLRVRSWDEQAKVPGQDVPGLDSYRERIEGYLRSVGG